MKLGVAARTLLAPLLIGAGLGCGALDGSGVTSNVPSSRLSATDYRSPGGEYTARLPKLVRPGLRIEERQESATTSVVAFGDDFGHFVSVEMTESRQPPATIAAIAATIALDDVVREKQLVTTQRGPELRGVLVLGEGSPLVATTTKAGVTTERRLDLIQARALFATSRHLFTVNASRTRLDAQQTDDELIRAAKQDLDDFLAGLAVSERDAPGKRP